MRLLFALLYLACLLSQTSCRFHQFYSFTSDRLKYFQKDSTNNEGFLLEIPEDSAKISFRWFKNTAVIEVENDNEAMIEIDWSKSALVLNGIQQDIFQPTSEIYRTLPLTPKAVVEKPFLGNANQRRRKTVTTTESYAMILPKSKKIYGLSNLKIPYFKQWLFLKPIRFRSFGFKRNNVRVLKHNFGKPSSPVKLRIYLTYKLSGSSIVRTIDENFWIHEIIQTYNRKMIALMGFKPEEAKVDVYRYNKIKALRNRHFKK